VRLVVQRVDSASLLVDNADAWVTIGRGLLIYVSFASGADAEAVSRAAKVVLGLPLCTLSGRWGDGAAASAYTSLCAKGEPPPLELLVVPQAALSGRAARKGRTLSYTDQIEKEEGRRLYTHFVASLRALVSEAVAKPPDEASVAASNKAAFQAKQAKRKSAALAPPEELFRTAEYSAWDGQGIPTHDAAGKVVTKNARKKLERRNRTARAKYDKQKASTTTAAAPDGECWSRLAADTLPRARASRAGGVLLSALCCGQGSLHHAV